MKITFNQTTQINNLTPIAQSKRINKRIENSHGGTETSVPPELTPAHFPNISFRMNPPAQFLLEQTSWLPCAYSGKITISPFDVRNIYKRLSKRPNTQSAINLLVQYEKYMHDIEQRVFEIFGDAPYKGKKNFQDILLQLQPDALIRLEDKQLDILNSKNSVIQTMSAPIKEQVELIRDNACEKMRNGTFTRKGPLDFIKKIKASGEDLEKVIQVYQAWYKLPASSKDINAFIVQYAKEPHEAIAKRLISTAVGTIEHVKPASRSGEDKLSNFLLVSSRFNNERNTMPLDEYIMLNDEIDIKQNLQRYIDKVIRATSDKRTGFYERSWYPEEISQTIFTESRGTFQPSLDGLNLSKAQRQQNCYNQRLASKYKVFHK